MQPRYLLEKVAVEAVAPLQWALAKSRSAEVRRRVQSTLDGIKPAPGGPPLLDDSRVRAAFTILEQLDTEDFAALSNSDVFPVGTNVDRASNIPPVLTKTWFHTGVFLGNGRVSRHLAHEYYREPAPSHALIDRIRSRAYRRHITRSWKYPQMISEVDSGA